MPQDILHIQVVLGGYVERRYPVDVLSDRTQRFAAGGKHVHLGARGHEGLGHVGRRLDHMLTAIQDQQEPLPANGGPDAVGGRRGGTGREAEGGRDSGRNQVGIAQRPKLGEPHAVGEAPEEKARRLEGQSRLAHATRTDQGHEPVRLDQIHHDAERSVSADQLG